MAVALQVQCPAKVNLFLEVTGKRPDGYHTLATIFSRIGLFDVLDAEVAERGFTLDVSDGTGQGLDAGPSNLVLRAAEAFRRAFRLRWGARFRLTKRIPMGAGLGGGSSDAAGALLALSRLYGFEGKAGWAARLRAIAPALGADVPFFVQKASLAEGRGIGERLRPLRTGRALPWLVLVFPRVAVPTAGVYRVLRLPGRAEASRRLAQLRSLERRLALGRPVSEWGDLLFNRLQEGVAAQCPEVSQSASILRRLGLHGVLMSGSGSSVFGFAATREEGERAAQRLKAYPWKTFLVTAI